LFAPPASEECAPAPAPPVPVEVALVFSTRRSGQLGLRIGPCPQGGVHVSRVLAGAVCWPSGDAAAAAAAASAAAASPPPRPTCVRPGDVLVSVNGKPVPPVVQDAAMLLKQEATECDTCVLVMLGVRQ
jgi:hypothetical protein